MKKLLVALCFTCALAIAVHAEEGKKQHKQMTDEQKTVKKETLAEIEQERRIGYSYYTTAPGSVIASDYPAWQKKYAP